MFTVSFKSTQNKVYLTVTLPTETAFRNFIDYITEVSLVTDIRATGPNGRIV